jgi:uncharacterized RmlC-like cupin family protein
MANSFVFLSLPTSSKIPSKQLVIYSINYTFLSHKIKPYLINNKKQETQMALPTMQKKNLDHPDGIDTYSLIKKEEVVLDGVTVHRVTFAQGARWSTDLKPYANTASCLLPHVAFVQSGRLHVVMDDHTEDEFGPNDIMMLPPGHDAWTVGDEPCVFIEFSAGGDYYSH